MTVLYFIMEFLCGSLMFSYWLGLLAKKDLTKVGDGNPGAFNLWLATGYKLGLLGVLLDFMKGYFPLVVLIQREMIADSSIATVAFAPILGHAFSPFLRGRGGKAIAVTFGVWSAVTQFRISLVYAVILAVLYVIARMVYRGENTPTETDGFMVVFGMWMLGLYLFFKAFPYYIRLLWLENSLLITYKNKEKLQVFFKNVYSKYWNRGTTVGM
nr:hypothetical protein [Clostridia bacterium]PZN08864.1 MAG: hypothetical protein DIU64_09795 [Caldicoprobacter oshimai]